MLSVVIQITCLSSLRLWTEIVKKATDKLQQVHEHLNIICNFTRVYAHILSEWIKNFVRKNFEILNDHMQTINKLMK